MYSGGMFIFKGFLGVLFGLLLIIFPDFTLGAFLTIFGIFLIAAGIISFLFAVTSRLTDTMFWFMISVGIIILGILTFIIPNVFAIVFAIAIAGWALITSVWDLDDYICSKRRFYAIMAGLSVASLALISVIFYTIPALRTSYLTTICGGFAVVFGIFALLLGQAIIRRKVPTCFLPTKTRA
jgi:uncharacterized membrane protein HdeD (DUF308 family)